jgi:hypothetical protein
MLWGWQSDGTGSDLRPVFGLRISGAHFTIVPYCPVDGDAPESPLITTAWCWIDTCRMATCVPPTSLSLTYRAAGYAWHARDKHEGQSEQRIVTSISVTCTLMHPITVTTLPTLNPLQSISISHKIRFRSLASFTRKVMAQSAVKERRILTSENFTRSCCEGVISTPSYVVVLKKSCSKLFVKAIKQQTSQSLRVSLFILMHILHFLVIHEVDSSGNIYHLHSEVVLLVSRRENDLTSLTYFIVFLCPSRKLGISSQTTTVSC